MNTLQDLLGTSDDQTKATERAMMDRNWYIRGKVGYPTTPPKSLPEATTERQRACYQMGYNYEEWCND